MPIRMDFEKKKKKRKKERKRKWPGANPDKRYMFQAFYFVLFLVNQCFYFLKVLTLHKPRRHKEPKEGAGEGDVGRGSRCICVSSPRCVFFSFSFYYINVNLQLNRLCILPPPPQNPSATTIRDRGSRHFCVSSFWYVFLSILLTFFFK